MWQSGKGQIDTITSASGAALALEFDGHLLTEVAASGTITGTVNYAYNNDFKLVGLSVNGDETAYGYDNDRMLIAAGDLNINRNAQSGFITNTILDDITSAFAHNGFGEIDQYVADFNGSNLLSVVYARDKLGRITNKTETVLGARRNMSYTRASLYP